MKPYNVEIFDENFNFLYTTLIDEDSFTYRYDAISPVKNKLNVPKDFNPKTLLNEPRAPKGWFIRITNDDEEYDGVISGFEEGETENTVEYSQILTLFDQDVVVETQAITSDYSIAHYLKQVLTANFIDNVDLKQNIPYLTVYFNSSKDGTLPYTNTDDKYVGVNVLNDLMLAAYKNYGIRTIVRAQKAFPSYDTPVLVVRFVDDSYYTTVPTFETNLPNIYDSSFTIKKQSGREVNKVIIKDTYFGTETIYYLYTDGTYSTNPSVTGKTRVFPVVSKVIIVNTYELAKNIVDSRYNDKVALVAQYTSYNGSIPGSVWSAFETACNDLMSKYFTYVGVNYTFNFNEYAKYYPEDTPPQWIVYPFTQTDVDRYGVTDLCKQANTYWTRFGSNNQRIMYGYSYDTEYNFYGHASFEVSAEIHGQYIRPGAEDPDDVEEWQYHHIAFTETLAKNAVSAYRNSSEYTQEIVAEASSQDIQYILRDKAKCEFSANEYSHNIEITVKKDDSLVRPLYWDVGQSFRIVRNGTTYNTILTGREIMKNGLVKLTFGTMRIELTKLLNMKGV